MRVDVNVNLYQHSTPGDLESKIDKILNLQEKMMAKVDDLKQELVEANAATNEIAADMDDLIKRVGEGSLSPAEADEVKSQLSALKDKLKTVAATHTPATT